MRVALISELSPHSDVIDLLVGDNDITVNYRARWQRAHRPGAPVVDAEWSVAVAEQPWPRLGSDDGDNNEEE